MIEGLVKSSLHTRLLVFILAVFVAGGGLVRVLEPDDRGVPRSDRHAGPGHHALPGPADRGGRAPRLDPARARAQRHARPVPAALDLAVRPVVRDADVRRRRRAARRAPAGHGAHRRRRPARRASQPELGPLATPIGEVYRYTLEGAGARPDDAAHAAGLGRAPGAHARARRRRRRVATAASSRRSTSSPTRRRWRRSASVLDDLFTALSKASAPTRRGGYVERGTRAVRDPLRRHRSSRSTTSARCASASTTACRCWCATSRTVTDGLRAAPGRRHARRRTRTPSRASC